jgi:hypothetical protein
MCESESERERERAGRGGGGMHRYILFPCDGVANPIKDVPTGGRPIRLSLTERSPHRTDRTCRSVPFP